MNSISVEAVIENRKQRQQWQQMNLSETGIVCDGKTYKLTDEELEFYTIIGASVVDIVCDIFSECCYCGKPFPDSEEHLLADAQFCSDKCVTTFLDFGDI
jgi:hypothetical protein